MLLPINFISYDETGREVYHYSCFECGKDIPRLEKVNSNHKNVKKNGGHLYCKECGAKHAGQTIANKDPDEKFKIKQKQSQTREKNKQELIEVLGEEGYKEHDKNKWEARFEKTKATKIKKYGSLENAYDSMVNNFKNTLFEKYGTTNINEIPGIREKREATCLEKYGVRNPNQNEEIKAKAAKTISERTDEDRQNILQKRIQTNMEKYGVPFAQQSEEVKEAFRQHCLETYGVDNPSKLPETRIKADKTIKERYGEWRNCITPEQREARRIVYRDENKEKYKTIDFSSKGFKYFVGEDEEPYVECLSCGEVTHLELSPSRIITDLHCPHCNPKEARSQTQTDFKNIFDSWGINVKENDRENLHGKEIDIYFPDYKLGIEYDGSFWHKYVPREDFSSGKDFIGKSDKNIHLKKLNECNKIGIELINLFDKEFVKKKDILLDYLRQLFDLAEKIPINECSIKETSIDDALSFLKRNYLFDINNYSSYLGIYYENNLVSVLGFNINNKDIEIGNFCNIRESKVENSLFNLIFYIEKSFNPKSIKYIHDKRWPVNKDLLNKSFSVIDSIEPQAWFFRRMKEGFFSREEFINLLKDRNLIYDDSLDDYTLGKTFDYSIIYDCGYDIYVKEYN